LGGTITGTPNASVTVTGNGIADGTVASLSISDGFVYLEVAAITYTVSYDANGGTGTIVDATKTHDVDLVLADGSGFAREGYIFAGWNTLADGTGTDYAAGATYSINADQTFYAVWNSTTQVNQIGYNEISIYPNPATDMIYFKNVPENSRMVMMDLTGRSILDINASELSRGLSLQPYQNGLYLIRIIHGLEVIATVKVIKN
jgi:uncharacterized repeat protein (TIGR02543 family)